MVTTVTLVTEVKMVMKVGMIMMVVETWRGQDLVMNTKRSSHLPVLVIMKKIVHESLNL